VRRERERENIFRKRVSENQVMSEVGDTIELLLEVSEVRLRVLLIGSV
jgi:hypothetical protein